MKLRSLAIAYLSFCILFSAQVWAQDKQDQPPQVEPKFIWGLVINFIIGELASMVFSSFKDWLGKKISTKMEEGLDAGVARLMSKDSGARIVDAESSVVLSKDAVNTSTDAPAAPFKLENGKENYQAAQISVGVADADGKLIFRPINQGFRGGERITQFVPEVQPNTYPSLTESIKLVHY